MNHPNPLNLPLCVYCENPLYNNHIMPGDFYCGHCKKLNIIIEKDGKLKATKTEGYP